MTLIWILVLVKKGFIQKPEIFLTRIKAENRKKELVKNFNKDYDEIDIFESVITL